jgi:rod shape-determining protein MreD
MKYLLWAGIIVITFIVQGTVSLFYVTPNFTAVLAYYAGVKKREIKGMCIGSLIGTVEDSLSGAFLGPNLLSKGIVGYLSSFISHRIFIWTPLLGVISISAVTLTDGLIVFLSRSIFDKTPMSISNAAFIIFIQCLMNAVFGAFIKPKDGEVNS